MSEEQLNAFMEAVKVDAGLQEKVNGAGDDAVAVVAIAKAAGYLVSADLLQGFPVLGREISEQELEGVAGGGCAHYNMAIVGCTN